MAGTSINVLLKENLTIAQKSEFANLLAEMSSDINGIDGIWNLLITNIPEVGTNYKCSERYFQICIQSAAPDLRQQYMQLRMPNLRFINTEGKQYWNWNPKEIINITAFSNEFIDQKLLCLLSIKFAKLYNGLIDMGGTVHPTSISNCCYNFSQRMKKRIRIFIKQINLKGQIVELPSYGINDDFIIHIVDAEYLKNWLSHSNFHMLKPPKRYVYTGANRKLSVTSYDGNWVAEKGELLGH